MKLKIRFQNYIQREYHIIINNEIFKYYIKVEGLQMVYLMGNERNFKLRIKNKNELSRALKVLINYNEISY